ncbi:MAG: hypothetical protein ACE5G8_03820 [Anaerolineae bacterium]
MKNFLNRLFRLRPGEAGLVVVLGFLLFSNAMAQQVSEISAISNFLSAGGVNQMLLVWVVDSLLIVLTTGLQSLIVDRFGRITLMRGMTFSFAVAFVILRLMFTLRAPGWLNYSLLYLLSEQQWLFFPLAFWVLASDVLDISQTRRLFPLIAGLGFAGRLLGIGVTALAPSLPAGLAVSAEGLLVLNALIYLLAFGLASAGLRRVKVRRTQHKSEAMTKTLTEGWAFVREVLSFRYLMLAIVALIVTETVVEFRFLVVTDAVFDTATGYQQFYSLYRLGFTVAALLLQSFVTSRLISRVTLKNAFLILPFTALTGVLVMMGPAVVALALAGVLLQKLPQYTVDESARKAFQALVPEERRGRVSIFMDSYLWAAGSLIGCAVTGGIVYAGIAAGVANYYVAYLIAGAFAALFAVWAVFKMRAVYSASLFNWRLKRRQRRTGVLDRLG